MKGPAPKHDNGEHIQRVRRICMALPGTTEKLSHGEPTFFVAKKVYVMFADNHHNDGHIAVWLPSAPGTQPALIRQNSMAYFKPPYVGVRGWIGVDLEHIDDDELGARIHEAWQMVAPKKAKSRGV